MTQHSYFQIFKKTTLPWYHQKDGLHFECTGCGGCCTGSPGYVWVNETEIEQIAAHLNMDIPSFTERYLIKVDERYSLKEDPENYDCPFLENKKRCTIYFIRPRQCRTFPWWRENLSSEEAWKEAAKRCEGIHPQAPLVSIEEIEKNLQQN